VSSLALASVFRAEQIAPVDPDRAMLATWLDARQVAGGDPVADRPLAHSECLGGLGNLQEVGCSLCHSIESPTNGGANPLFGQNPGVLPESTSIHPNRA
jgi:hypothetical protein